MGKVGDHFLVSCRDTALQRNRGIHYGGIRIGIPCDSLIGVRKKLERFRRLAVFLGGSIDCLGAFGKRGDSLFPVSENLLQSRHELAEIVLKVLEVEDLSHRILCLERPQIRLCLGKLVVELLPLRRAEVVIASLVLGTDLVPCFVDEGYLLLCLLPLLADGGIVVAGKGKIARRNLERLSECVRRRLRGIDFTAPVLDFGGDCLQRTGNAGTRAC